MLQKSVTVIKTYMTFTVPCTSAQLSYMSYACL